MCIGFGDSCDRAANMSGVYNGLQALLKQVRPIAMSIPGVVHTSSIGHW